MIYGKEYLQGLYILLERELGTDCECDNTHIQNSTSCIFCFHRGALADDALQINIDNAVEDFQGRLDELGIKY